MPEHRAYLAALPNVIFKAVAARAFQNGFVVEQTDTKMTVTAPLGQVVMVAIGNGIDLTLSADTPEKLQLFTDIYAQRFAEFGLENALTWQEVTAKSPLNQTLTKVVSSTQISPNFMRLRLAGDFSSFARPGAGLHFRMLFNADGLDWPTLDHRGITRWPGGVNQWHRPPYTLRRLSPEADWLDVDIVLHSDGRVTDWAQQVSTGTEIALHGPSGGTQPTANWLGMIGDETALPVIMRMIEDAPTGTQGQARILLRDPLDAQKLQTASDITLTWGSMAELADPAQLLARIQPTCEDYYLFFAAERSQAEAARKAFKASGLPTKRVKAASYWHRAS